MHPLRIALFADTYPPQVNGVARTLARLVEHLEATGHEVLLVTPAVGEPVPPTSDRFSHHTRPGIAFPLYPELQLTSGMGGSIRAKLEAFDPHVVHCATESALGWSGRRWALRTGRTLVTSFHTNFATYATVYGLGFAEGLIWRTLRRFHAPAALTLCPSSDTLSLLQSRGFHPRLRVWSRGVDSILFHPGRRSEPMRARLGSGADVVLLYVGRLAPEKRLGMLLDAYPTVRAQGARNGLSVGLALVGSGPLEAEIQSRGLPGVVLTGALSGLELAAAYASADVFVFPSDSETFGNVVTEAMASGLPVVGVNQGGVRDTVLPGKTGLLSPPGDTRAFAASILTLIGNPTLRSTLARSARTSAESRSWSRILDGVLAAYAEAGQVLSRIHTSPSTLRAHP